MRAGFSWATLHVANLAKTNANYSHKSVKNVAKKIYIYLLCYWRIQGEDDLSSSIKHYFPIFYTDDKEKSSLNAIIYLNEKMLKKIIFMFCRPYAERNF